MMRMMILCNFFTGNVFILGMHRILFLPDTRPAGYPVNPKAGWAIWYPVGYRISEKAGLSGRISGASLI
jgi:hypothetical protein